MRDDKEKMIKGRISFWKNEFETRLWTKLLSSLFLFLSSTNGYVCLMFHRRDSHIIEMQLSEWSQQPDDVCNSSTFNSHSTPYTTFISKFNYQSLLLTLVTTLLCAFAAISMSSFPSLLRLEEISFPFPSRSSRRTKIFLSLSLFIYVYI